ncbi:Ref family recombination enhancement nuclease [Luteimonas sp. FXH3W]|uniref:Ref family recombination enhancement nuclease n=1 Tax=Aquilutibacter rugosus TaxID=3115820 RepID=A0ABU7V2V3_9GAMM
MSFYSRSLPAPTKAQRARMDAIKNGVCIPCLIRGKRTLFPEINHLLSGGLRISHDATVGECQWHHRRIPNDGWSFDSMREMYGPSRLCSPREFHAAFGTDKELLEVQNEMLGVL